MNFIQFISYGVNGMLFLSFLFALILAVKNYEREFNLYFAAVLACVMVFNGANTIAVSLKTLTVDDYIFVEKLTNISMMVCGIIYLRLISLLSGFKSKVFYYILFGMAIGLLILNIILPYGVVISGIPSIEKITAPWGEQLNNITIVASEYMHFVNAFIVGVMVYIIAASRYAFKHRHRYIGFLIISSLLPPVAIIMVVSVLIDFTIILPFIGYFFDGLGFSFLVLVLSYQSVREIFNSVSQRKELQEKEDKYRLLFDNAGDSIFLLLNGRIEDCNAATLSVFRCLKEEFIGKNVQLFSPEFQIDGKHSELTGREKAAVVLDGDNQLFTWTFKRLDGTYFEAEVQLNRLIIGKKKYIQAIVRDVTNRIEAENMLRNSEEKYRELTEYLEDTVNVRTFELAETNKQLESFTYSISHDLRSPLRAIDTFSRMLLEEEYAQLSDDGKRRLETIRSNTAKMSAMIDDLLAFARTNKIEMKWVTVDVNILVKKIIAELSSKVSNRIIEFTVDALPKVVGDPTMLHQVFLNLIDNAIKFTRNRETATIHISGWDSEIETTFTVQDNGCGFDMVYSNVLFGVFQRLHSEKEYEGSGVGLAIVRRIVQRHGGSVSAAGEFDNGARFTISLSKLKAK